MNQIIYEEGTSDEERLPAKEIYCFDKYDIAHRNRWCAFQFRYRRFVKKKIFNEINMKFVLLSEEEEVDLSSIAKNKNMSVRELKMYLNYE